MNWEEIENKYPNAYDKFWEWDTYMVWDDRLLYNFFDEQGIPITISPDYYGSMECHSQNYPEDKEDIYYWLNVNFAYEDNVEYKTRVECETAAFLKAFEILERKLK